MNLKKLTGNRWIWNIGIIIVFFGVLYLGIIILPHVIKEDTIINPIDNSIPSEKAIIIESDSYHGAVRFMVAHNGEIKFVGWSTKAPEHIQFKQIEVTSAEEFQKTVGSQKVYSFIINKEYTTLSYVGKTYFSFMPDEAGIYVYQIKYDRPGTGYKLKQYDDNNIYWHNDNSLFMLTFVVLLLIGDIILAMILLDKRNKACFIKCTCCSKHCGCN